MNKTVVVGIREFRQRVRSRGFLIGSIATPLILVVIWLFTGAFGDTPQQPAVELPQAGQPDVVIGYVDQANLIQSIPASISPDVFQALPDTAAAETALASGEIDAYYVVPPDYRETGNVRRISERITTAPADTRWFDWVLVGNLLPGDDQDQLARLRWPLGQSGPRFVALSPSDESAAGSDDAAPREGWETGSGRQISFLPFLVTIAVIIPLFTSGGYLFQSLAQEKSNRVLEILLVSLRPRQLLTGKLLGLGVLTLVQYLIWLGIGLLVLVFSGADLAQLLSGIHLSAGEVLVVVPYALGGFTLYAALMAGIGALTPDIESSRTWVFIITLPMMIPMYLWVGIATAPNGPLAVVLSLFPYSSPVAMLMRMTSTAVPAWQLGASLAFLALAGIGTVWLMARLFRTQTLLSGEPISLRRIWAALST